MVNKITFGQTSTPAMARSTIEDMRSLMAGASSIPAAPKVDGFNKTNPVQEPEKKSHVLAWIATIAVAALAVVTGRHYVKAYKLEKFTRETFDVTAKPVVEKAVTVLREKEQALKETGTAVIAKILTPITKNSVTPKTSLSEESLGFIFGKVFGNAEGQYNIADTRTSGDLIAYALDHLRLAFKQEARKTGLNKKNADRILQGLSVVQEGKSKSAVSEAVEHILAQRIQDPVRKEADSLLSTIRTAKRVNDNDVVVDPLAPTIMIFGNGNNKYHIN